MAISQNYINVTLGNIQTLHGRFASELCDILKRHTGNIDEYYKLVSINNTIGVIKNIFYDYIPYGITELNDSDNDLTEDEMNSLINYAYRVLNKYSSNIYLPTDPNIYL